MKRPTTTQNNRFFTREFIHLSFEDIRQTEKLANPAECYHTFRRGNNLSCGLLLLLISLIERCKIRQVAILLPIVEAVPDHKLIRDLESHVLEIHLDSSTIRLAQQRADLQRPGLSTG
jgi:hypothetical protein